MEVSLKFLVALHPGLLFGCLLRAARLFEKSAGGLSPPRDTIGEIISCNANARHVFNLKIKSYGSLFSVIAVAKGYPEYWCL